MAALLRHLLSHLTKLGFRATTLLNSPFLYSFLLQTLNPNFFGFHFLSFSSTSSDIRLSLARLSVATAARVSILSRNCARLDEAVDFDRHAMGVEICAFSADVKDYEAVKRAVDEAGPIDVLICNHGVFIPQEMEVQDLEEVNFNMEVNLMGTFHLIKATHPAMKRRAKETGLPASISIIYRSAASKTPQSALPANCLTDCTNILVLEKQSILPGPSSASPPLDIGSLEGVMAVGTEEAGGDQVAGFFPQGSLRVLLVEGDDSTRQIIAALLRKYNYKVD